MTQPASDDSLWCRRYRPAKDATARLVCLPHAGGSAPYFRPVAMALNPTIDVVAVQYPGRQDRRSETPIGDMMQLADRLYGVLRREPELPLTLFGHSMGAILGFELARRFEADSQADAAASATTAPLHLFVSGRRAPSTHRDEAVHLRDDEGILAELRRMDGTASIILNDEEMLRAALPALRADYRATETYHCPPDTAVGYPITALTGDDDPKTTIDEAKAWSRHTTGAFSLQVYPGGHFYLADNVAKVNAMLTAHFATATRAAASA
jgi:surfactin synthase thioesterase subunit